LPFAAFFGGTAAFGGGFDALAGVSLSEPSGAKGDHENIRLLRDFGIDFKDTPQSDIVSMVIHK
jgi:hypothetical protein